MYNYTPQAKFDFDPTTWVVWANSQFATVSGVFLPSFLFLFSSARLQVAPADDFCLFFTKNRQNSARNRQFQAKMLKHEIQDISEITKPNAVKI